MIGGASGLLGGHLFLMEKYDRNMRGGASGLLGGHLFLKEKYEKGCVRSPGGTFVFNGEI